MKLRNAMICLDCDEVFEQETVHFMDQKVAIEYCPSCTNFSIVWLSRWIPTIKSIEPRAESKESKTLSPQLSALCLKKGN